MDRQFFLNTFDQSTIPTWHSLSAMETQSSDLHFPTTANQSFGCFFESAVSNESFVVRELIGKLGNIYNSGEISPPANAPAQVAGASCYSTPLSSPPNMSIGSINRAIMENFTTHLGNSNPIPQLGSDLPELPGDPGHVERTGRFSSFGSRSVNDRTSQFVCGKLQRVSSSPSINGPPMAENRNSSSAPQVRSENGRKISRFSGNCGLNQGKLRNYGENSSVLEPTHPVGETGSRPGNDVNSSTRKRKLPKEKCKEIPYSSPAQVVENEDDLDDLNAKRSKMGEQSNFAKAGQKLEERADERKKRDGNSTNQKPPEPPKDYIHVRARRGQATDSHSLAERARREKISERMKLLQDLVPGCNKVTGKALMLEEIINYVQSLQRQVEFLSMKLASVNPTQDFNTDSLFQEDVFQQNCSLQTHPTYPLEPLAPNLYGGHQHPQDPWQQNGISSQGMGPPCSNPMAPVNQSHDMQLPTIDGFNNGVPELCEGDLHTIVQIGFGQNTKMQDNSTFQPQSQQGKFRTMHNRLDQINHQQ